MVLLFVRTVRVVASSVVLDIRTTVCRELGFYSSQNIHGPLTLTIDTGFGAGCTNRILLVILSSNRKNKLYVSDLELLFTAF